MEREGISAWRIQRMLLRQYWVDADHWNYECGDLTQDFEAYALDPKSPAIDCSTWCDTNRPEWPEEERKAQLHDEPLRLSFKTFPTPLWGWLAMAKWKRTSSHHVEDLFRVLMRCGCDTAAALNARRDDTTPLLAAVAVPHAFSLLIQQPNVSVDARTLESVLKHSRDATNAEAVLSRLSLVEKTRALVFKGGSLLLRALDNHSPTTAFALFSLLVESTSEVWEAVFRSAIYRRPNDAGTQLEATHLVHQPNDAGPELKAIDEEGQYRWCLMSFITRFKNRKIFSLLSQTRLPLRGDERSGSSGLHAFAVQLYSVTLKMTSRAFISPLCFTLSGDAEDRDERGAWLALRLPSEHLNRYHVDGRTAVMIAAADGHVLTLRALLLRGVQVELTANPITKAPGQQFVAVDALANSATRYDGTCAVDLLRNPLPFSMCNVAQELKVQTKWQREVLPMLITGETKPILLSDAKLSMELVALVCAYLGAAKPNVLAETVLDGAERADDARPLKRQRTSYE